MRKIVIIGRNSYLAGGLVQALSASDDVQTCTHSSWRESLQLIRDADCVVNFAISPEFMQRDMEEGEVLDVQLAEELKKGRAHFLFMSSRKVYGITTECLTHRETDPLPTSGGDAYARNKRKTEAALQSILGERVGILRVPNIVGSPVRRGNYGTFVGWIAKSYVRTGKLVCNQSPDTVKDFITTEFLDKAMLAVISKKLGGIYNISSNLPVTIAKLLGENVGAGNLVFEPPVPAEQFLLDNAKLKRDTGLCLTEGELLGKARENKALLDQWRKEYAGLASDEEKAAFFS